MTEEGVLPPRRRHLAGGLLLLAFALVGGAALQSSRAAFTNFVMPADPGPFALPALCLLAVGATGIGLLIAGLRAPRDPAPATGKTRSLMPLLFLASVVAMPVLMAHLGTAPAVALFTFGWMMVIAGGPLAGRLLRSALVGLGTGLAVYVIFIRLLTLPLPS